MACEGGPRFFRYDAVSQASPKKQTTQINKTSLFMANLLLIYLITIIFVP
ncbi:MAG: hypothetical protein KAS70_07485 [Planctomycetes bacterium]|nr:hypothetical protein [Planctomycetota bacterium]